jgi:hypothetical protein
MRLVATLVIFAAVSITTAHASASGAYATPAAESADDCVKLCQDDTLCVGSTYESSRCGLWASVPNDAPSQFVLSDRAPNFVRPAEVAEAVRPPVRRAPVQSPARETPTATLLGGDDSSEGLRPRLGGN